MMMKSQVKVGQGRINWLWKHQMHLREVIIGVCHCLCLGCHNSRLSRTELEPTSLAREECRDNKGLLLLLLRQHFLLSNSAATTCTWHPVSDCTKHHINTTNSTWIWVQSTHHPAEDTGKFTFQLVSWALLAAEYMVLLAAGGAKTSQDGIMLLLSKFQEFIAKYSESPGPVLDHKCGALSLECHVLCVSFITCLMEAYISRSLHILHDRK